MAIADKFYTKTDIAKQCVDFLSKYEKIEGNIIEPSAGSGNFLIHLPDNTIALDILPENNKIKKMNFFDFKTDKNDFITIGNPPFGKRSSLAIDFFNYAASFSKTIAFILPVSFMKYGVQKQLDKNFKLVNYIYLPENSFTDNNKDFSVRCVFMVWKKISNIDHRLKKSPPIEFKDFELWQYNATEQSLDTIDKDWELAFYRQGIHNYNNVFTKNDYDFIKNHMTGNWEGKTKQQFFFVKPKSEEIKNKILKMDMNQLADRNTTLQKGFGKADFISYYCELYGEII